VPAVSVRHLAKSYGDKQAVRDVSFEVEKGDVFALLGPNGAGKTTTIEILEGFRDRSGGEVETLGVDPATAARSGGCGPASASSSRSWPSSRTTRCARC
jgi:ABC-2 type transport system ATP-binding protein